MAMNAPEKPSQLTRDNYYSNEQDWLTQSKSWFWRFEKCEAEALAALKGDWNPPQDLEPLLVGNFVHTHFESAVAHAEFLAEHEDEIISKSGKTKGQPKKAFKKAENMIATLEDDTNFQKLYQGKKEVIVTGTLFGVKWRGRIDCLNLQRGQFYDLKTVDDIHKKHWIEESNKPVAFAQERGYDMQMAIYRELIYQTYGVKCEPLIIAVSKQEQPDKGVFSIPDYLMENALDTIKYDQPHIEAVKASKEKPTACGHCAYCRSQKLLEDVIPIDEIPFY